MAVVSLWDNRWVVNPEWDFVHVLNERWADFPYDSTSGYAHIMSVGGGISLSGDVIIIDRGIPNPVLPKPLIDVEYDYRSVDISHQDSILVKLLSTEDEFLSLGSTSYKRNFVIAITIRTAGDRTRKNILVAETRRILRTVRYWSGQDGTGYNNLVIVTVTDSLTKMRKMSEVVLTVNCWRAELVDDINL